MNSQYFIVEKQRDTILLGNLLSVPKDYTAGYLAPLSLLSQSAIVKHHDWENILTSIINSIEAKYTISKYIIDNCHEIFNIVTDKYDNRPVIKKLKIIFRDTGILSRVEFSDNNLDLTNVEGIPNRPYPYFLGWNAASSLPIVKHKRKFEKKFLFMNRIDKFHRRWLLGRFISDGLLQDINWSYNVNNPNAPIHKVLGLSEMETGSEEVTYTVHDFMPSSFCHIICETNFNLSVRDAKHEGGYGHDNRFITEKTEKAFTTGNPFIAVSGPRYLEKLKELGFKTFDKWWDESYDQIQSPIKRLNAILDLIKEINKLGYEDLIKMWNDMIPVLKHNQELNKWYFIQALNGINTRFPGHHLSDIEGLYFNSEGSLTYPDKVFRNYKTI